MRVPWNKGIKLKDNPKYSRMGFQNGHTHHEHPNCKKTQFKKGQAGHKGFTHTEESKKQNSESRRGKCIGETNPSWKGGITPLLNKIKRLPEYTQWCKAVLNRDNFTCQKCAKRGGNLNPHHLTAFSFMVREAGVKQTSEAIEKAELWDIENGVTLCVDCHKETPNYGYRAGSNPIDETVYQLTNTQ